MKKRRRWLFVIAGVLLLVAVWFATSFRHEQNQARTAPATAEAAQVHSHASKPKKLAVNSIRRTNEQVRSVPTNTTKGDAQQSAAWREEAAKWRTPLHYFGKVVDENGGAIPGVQISYNANSINETLTKEVYNAGTVTTDERGIFKIDGVLGIGATFQLSHRDYYPFPDNMTGFDIRSRPRSGINPDSEETAEVFRMHKKNNAVLLIHRRGGADVPVGKGNAMVEFLGEGDKQRIGTMKIEARGNTPKNWSSTPYDWSVRLSVPNGGLFETTNYFDFVAPESGYQQAVEINMSKDQPGWSDSVDKLFFVKLPSGYARMQLHMRAKTPLYVSLEYDSNPDGSRNLEPAESQPQHHDLPPGVTEVHP